MFWKSSVDIEFKWVAKNLMDFHVHYGSVSFFVFCIYGDLVIKNRPKVWEKLMCIGITRKEGWCMLRDFNEILHNEEKLGGPRRGEKNFMDFTEMIRICGMVELPFSGNGFTWGEMRNQMWIQCKLDIYFGNKAWYQLFPVSNQSFLEKRGSDHRLVFVKLLDIQRQFQI